jgi:hypothetical protein
MLRTLRSLMEIGIGATAAIMLVACSYNPPVSMDTPEGLYQTLNTAPYANAYAAERWSVVNDPGRLRVDHGYDCAYASRAATRDYIGVRVRNRAAIPANYNATVFMNGWKANYTKKDHHVLGLGSVIFNIDHEGGDLVWEAGGLIADKNGDDSYKWCYDYTLVFWPTNSSEFDIRAIHGDSSGRLLFLQSPQQSGAVHSIPASYTAPNDNLPHAALPSGFAMLWTDKDHHVLQAGFDLGNQSLSGRTLGWNSSALLKDDKASRSYYAAEAVSVLRGRGFGVTHPSTVLRQKEDGSWASQSNALQLVPRSPTSCAGAEVGAVNGEHVRHFKITGLSTKYAIPMLTGWDLRYNCNDQHVRSVGAWIEDFSYEPPTVATTGTLSYTVRSTLADKNGTPNFIDQLEVSVLGVDLLRLFHLPGDGVILDATRPDDGGPPPSRRGGGVLLP